MYIKKYFTGSYDTITNVPQKSVLLYYSCVRVIYRPAWVFVWLTIIYHFFLSGLCVLISYPIIVSVIFMHV
jgi:hypothetical protein